MEKKSVVKDANLLFDLKESFVQNLSEVEKEIFELNSKIKKLEEILQRMSVVARNNNSQYFQKRILKAQNLIKIFIEKKGYGKKEFDSLFHEIGKVKRSDSIELLNESLKNRLEKISEIKFKSENLDAKKKAIDKSTYLVFRFLSVNFIVENSPKKIIRNVDRLKTKCKIEGKTYPVFPTAGFGLDPSERIFDEFCDLLILKTETGYRCFHFDELGLPVHFSKDTFGQMLKKTEKPLNFIQYYIKWKGVRYYYLTDSQID